MPHVTNIESRPSHGDIPNEFDAFLALADVWRLNTDQQITLLGNPARSTYFKWKKQGGSMSSDTEERISHLVAIYKALQILFPEPHRADAWLERPHRFFGGRSALDVMLDGKLQDIIRVREYLDAQRGG
jgi:uncharacterized protein (DUF2384 family)